MNMKKLIIVFSIIGFLISVYLYFEGRKMGCALNGCDLVLTSKYSKFLGIDNSLLGMVYFFLIGLFSLLNKTKFLKIISIFALFFALYLLFVMFFVLKEICPFCLIVDFIAIIIFVLIYDFRKYFQKVFGS